MKLRGFFMVLLSTVLFSGCASTGHSTGTDSGSEDVGAGGVDSCRKGNIADIQLKDIPADEVSRTFESGGAGGLGGYQVAGVQEALGPCATKIVGFMVDGIYLHGGITMHMQGRVAREEARYPFKGPDITNGDTDLGSDFVQASRIGYLRDQSGLKESYIGLWRSPSSSEVAVFLKSASGVYGKKIALFKTNLDISGLRYFPSPDASAGQITLLVNKNDNPWLVRVDWTHPGIWEAMNSIE